VYGPTHIFAGGARKNIAVGKALLITNKSILSYDTKVAFLEKVVAYFPLMFPLLFSLQSNIDHPRHIIPGICTKSTNDLGST
jgi:hypothetical protein